MNMQKILVVLTVALLAVAGCQNNDAPMAPSKAPITGVQALDIEQGIPSIATIDSARFYVHVTDSGEQTVLVHRVTGDWSQGDVTWNSLGTNFVDTAFTTFNVTNSGWVNFDATNLVTSWFDSTLPNYGVLLNPAAADTNFINYNSTEASSNQPFLEICYTTDDGSFCEEFTISMDAYIDQARADSTFGDEATLITGRDTSATSTVRTLLQADFPVFVPAASVGDFVWHDMNENGLQDDGEPGLEGIAVNLYAADGELVQGMLTDADGMYVFDSVSPGDYYLEIDVPEDWMLTMANMGDDDAIDSDFDPMTALTDTITLDPGEEDFTWDAGLVQKNAVIGDFVWNDMNENGLQDEGEPGIEGITVRLWSCDGMMVAETTTDADGMYLFEEVEDGDYYLEFTRPFGYVFTFQDQGDDDMIDSDVNRFDSTTMCFTVAPGDTATMWDAGLFAFEGCTYGKGYWKNHAGFGPQMDVVSELLPIWLGNADEGKSIPVTDAQTAVDVLGQFEYGHPSNGITKLYAHFLTTKLNIANFANPADIIDVVDEVDDFLAMYDWNDWDMLSKMEQKDVLKWKDMLEEYNEGYVGPGSCDDDHDDDDDDMDDDDDDMDDDDDYADDDDEEDDDDDMDA